MENRPHPVPHRSWQIWNFRVHHLLLISSTCTRWD